MITSDFPFLSRASRPIRQGWDRLARNMVLSQAAKLRFGTLDLLEEGEARLLRGSSDPDRVRVRLEVFNRSFFGKLLLGGTIGAGESYMDGDFACDDLAQLSHLMVLNQEVMNRMESGLARLREPYHRLLHYGRYNRPEQSRKNIQNHYDLGNGFFRLYLDESMNYSAAIFPHDSATLHEASLNKMRTLCEKLELHSKDHLLEIGSGWGGLAIYAAEHYGCRVTTTTISSRQYQHVLQLVRKKRLKSKVQVLNQDYRRLKGSYSKIVSVEMIEAIGHQFFPTFFRKCDELLEPEGLLALQCIAIQDQAFEAAKHGVDFLKKYIFPGSCIPSVRSLVDAMTEASSFSLYDLEDITPHYARTLRAWRDNLLRRRSDVLRQGFSERFFRMWEFYLALCEGAFLGRYMKDVQMVLSKPLSRPQTRFSKR